MKSEAAESMAALFRQVCKCSSQIATRSMFPTGIRRFALINLNSSEQKVAFCMPRTSLRSIRTSTVASKTVNITFIDRDEDKSTVQAKVGDTLLDVAKDNDIDLEGACEGTLACSTCHLVFDPDQYEKLKLAPPSEEELDMLDLAYGLTDTSRLGCQIEVTEDMDGLVLRIPISVDARDA